MDKDKNKTIYEKFIANGNRHFRNKEFARAIDDYELSLSCYPELYAVISANIDLTRRKFNKVSPCTKRKYKLLKPESLETHIFEKIEESGLFDVAWYLSQYGETYKVRANPLEHYLEIGWKSGLNPSKSFDTGHYIRSNPDLKDSELHPFVHYVCQGRGEGRIAVPPPPPDYSLRYPIGETKYIPRLPSNSQAIQKTVRVIAFYLPQFHAIPENDKWWGQGFTEWTNVKPANPQFDGHYQPHIPDDYLGHYNLLDGSTQARQVELAKQYGIEGFCFYLYWFTGHKLLQQPVENYLADKRLDLNFCVCWANENWSRRWDGLDQDILMEQHYSGRDDIEFIENVSKYLRDPRYIRVNHKPILLIYRPALFPDIKGTVKRWRNWCNQNGIGEIFLVYPQSFDVVNPADYGFDAACEFPPNNSSPPNITAQMGNLKSDFNGAVYDWRVFLERSENYNNPGYTLFRSVTPSWDNTARKKKNAVIFWNNCPSLFRKWLTNAFVHTVTKRTTGDEQLVFVNAWNEWAEGAHLEPDRKYGYAHLQAIRDAHVCLDAAITESKSGRIAIIVHVYYIDVFLGILDRLRALKTSPLKIFITTVQANYAPLSEMMSSSGLEYEIYTFDNRGRDILPFLAACPTVLREGFDYILKLHTKKSTHRVDGDQWRDEILDELLSDEFFLKALIDFKENKNLGVISPKNQLVEMSYYFGSNEERVITLSNRVGLGDIEKLESLSFVAGSMFFVRREVVAKLVSLNLHLEEFEPELGQVDGTLAHAIERFISVVCESAGFETKTLSGETTSRSFQYAVRGR